MKTKVINLFGGPGVGKSTTAAGLFYHAKLKGINAELTSEHIKGWAWRGIKPNNFDRLYLLGKQSHYESRLYGKVDLLITDSPLLLAGVYERIADMDAGIGDAARNFVHFAERNKVKHLNFLLKRKKAYNPAGRYQTEEEAKGVDVEIENYLVEWGIPYTTITSDDEARVKEILEMALC